MIMGHVKEKKERVWKSLESIPAGEIGKKLVLLLLLLHIWPPFPVSGSWR